MTNRIVEHPVLGKLTNRPPVTFTFDGKIYEGMEGDTIASALLANGIRQLRVHEGTGAPRAMYCFECRVTVNDAKIVRACMTPIQNEMVIESGKMQPAPFKASPTEWPRTYAEFEKMNDNHKEGVPHA